MKLGNITLLLVLSWTFMHLTYVFVVTLILRNYLKQGPSVPYFFVHDLSPNKKFWRGQKPKDLNRITYAWERRTFSLLGFVLWAIVCIFIAFSLVMVLSVLLRFTTSDYAFSIFKCFVWNLSNNSTLICTFAQSGQFHHLYFFFFRIFDNLSTYPYKWLLRFWISLSY
jgi:hypothetical protein